MDYGITTTAKIKPSPLSENKDENDLNFLARDATRQESNKLHHRLDNEALAKVLSVTDPYIELANEAMLCANHIENGIAQQTQQSKTSAANSSSSSSTTTYSGIEDASLPGEQWRINVPDESDDYARDHIEMFDRDTSANMYSER